MTTKPLPIGIQTFRKIIEGGYLYVDKTRWIYELIRYPGGVYFLSRPRRFGKSLLISTLDEIFQGQRELFRGLWLYDSPYRWETHPVIRVDFSRRRVHTGAELIQYLKEILQHIAQQAQLTLENLHYQGQFEELIRKLAAQNKVAILVDEYDKPILDNIENVEEAKRVQEVLKSFYTVIKSMDAYVRFVLLTGVSKFSQVGVFSGLNNLEDLTMTSTFSALLGITEDEVQTFCRPYLETISSQHSLPLEKLMEQVRFWYNGFCFAADCQNVYNPFSLFLFLKHQHFTNYWFESGTPTFLIKLLWEHNYDVKQLDRLEVGELGFSSYEIDNLRVIPLLFQTGYLTIKAFDPATRLYTLYYPNYEVEYAFMQVLLGSFSAVEEELTEGYLWQLIRALQAGDLERFFEVLAVFFADIPYDIQIQKERYYQTVFYLIFKLIGLEVGAEVRTGRGRIDAVVELESDIFLFEFKLDGSAAEALKQIKEKEYFTRYHLKGKTLHLVGVNFEMEKRGVADWEVEIGHQPPATGHQPPAI